MRQAIRTSLFGLVVISNLVTAIEPRQPDVIRFSRDKDALFLNADDLAKSLELELKIVDPRRLVTFCRDKEGGYCIPIRLSADNHRRNDDQLLIAADVVSQALRFRVIETDGRITIARQAEPATGDVPMPIPAYNSKWGSGRGFGKGETLPDIPQVDIAGNEVRFSHFLGKRYILYCWASW